MKPMLYILVGLPGSGKSTYAKKLKVENDNMVIVSSDQIREDIFNDVNDQTHNVEVFEIMHKRTRENLKRGRSIIYDATNISEKKRRGLLKSLSHIDCNKVALYFNTPYEQCVANRKCHEGRFPEHVIKRMYLRMQIPSRYEGFDETKIIDWCKRESNVFKFENIKTFEDYKNILYNNGLYYIIDYNQNNPYHKLTLDKHMWDIYQRVCHSGYNLNSPVIKTCALFHDIGKPFTRTEDMDGVAHYIGHANVSAQMVIEVLRNYQLPDFYRIMTAKYIEHHMDYFKIQNDKRQIKSFIKRYDSDFNTNIKMFNEIERND